jgi:hypothetical protein
MGAGIDPVHKKAVKKPSAGNRETPGLRLRRQVFLAEPEMKGGLCPLVYQAQPHSQKEITMKDKMAVSRMLVMVALIVCCAIPAFAQLTIDQILPANLPTIDGDISEWTSLGDPDLTQAQFSSTTGEISGLVPEDDQKVEVWLGWSAEEDMIYIAARVTDDSFLMPTSTWNGDIIEVYLDADNSGGSYDDSNVHAQQYVLAPDPIAEVQSVRTSVVEVQGAAQREGTVYTYEMAIPGWDVVEGAGALHDFELDQVISLTIVFPDFEEGGSGYHAFNGLNGPIGAWGDADQFTDFQLIGPAEPPVIAPPIAPPTVTGGFYNELRVMTSSAPRRGFAMSSGPVGGRAELTSRSKPTTLQVKSWGEIKAQIEERE